MNERIIPWGTIVAGAIALATAVLIGLVQVGGWTIPFQTAGPGAVIVVGVLIVLAGLFAVLRSTRTAARRGPTARVTAADSPPIPTPPLTPSPAISSPAISSPASPSPDISVSDISVSDISVSDTSVTHPETVSAAQGPAESLSAQRPDGDAAQSSH